MSQLNVDSIKDRTGADQPDIVGVAKAFVNFNGTGTVAIRNGFNVSSITDNGTGIFQINYTDALPDVNYTATTNSTTEATGSVQVSSQSGSATVLYCRQINASIITFFDPSIVSAVIHR